MPLAVTSVAQATSPQDGVPSLFCDLLATPSVLLDAQFRVVRVSDALASALCRHPSSLVGRDAVVLAPATDLDGLMAHRAALIDLATGASLRDTRLIVRAGGDAFRCTTTTLKLRAEDGSVLYAQWLDLGLDGRRPATASRATQPRAAASPAAGEAPREHDLFEAAAVALAVVCDGRVTKVNFQFEQQFGWRADEVLQAGPGAILGSPRAWRRQRLICTRALRDADEWNGELALFRRSGARSAFDVRVRWVDPARPHQGAMVTLLDISALKHAEQERLQEITSQRDLLIREIHHRIKNNLQGVAGLLYQIGQRKPQFAETLNGVANQISSIAQVYGLQVRDAQDVSLADVLAAVLRNLSRTTGIPFAVSIPDPFAAGQWLLSEQDAVPVALIINELATNAMKHRAGAGGLEARLDVADDGLVLELSNTGTLPPEFDLGSLATSVSGLGLVKAMLPRRSATLTLAQQAGRVVARLRIGAPAVARQSR